MISQWRNSIFPIASALLNGKCELWKEKERKWKELLLLKLEISYFKNSTWGFTRMPFKIISFIFILLPAIFILSFFFWFFSPLFVNVCAREWNIWPANTQPASVKEKGRIKFNTEKTWCRIDKSAKIWLLCRKKKSNWKFFFLFFFLLFHC